MGNREDFTKDAGFDRDAADTIGTTAGVLGSLAFGLGGGTRGLIALGGSRTTALVKASRGLGVTVEMLDGLVQHIDARQVALATTARTLGVTVHDLVAAGVSFDAAGSIGYGRPVDPAKPAAPETPTDGIRPGGVHGGESG